MPQNFDNLDNDKGLGKMNGYLSSYSYIEGYLPSQNDVVHAAKLKNVDAKKFAHVARWLKHINSFSDEEKKAWPSAESVSSSATTPAPKAASNEGKKPKAQEKKADDDDFDLFDDEEEDEEEYERQLQERIKKAQEAKGKKKDKPVAKSMVILDVKVWEAETDLKELERMIREIAMEGLLWGKAEQKEVAFGVKKLVIAAVIEDDKVSVDDLQEKIEAFEDFVQSTDVASFNKL